MTDFRALCQELMDEAIYLGSLHYEEYPDSDLIARASTALAQPEPQGPTDEELRAFYDSEDNDEYEWPWWHRIFRVLLTRYARPAIEPVPVAERLPGEEDCDLEGLLRLAENGLNALRNQVISSQDDYDAIFVALNRLASLSRPAIEPVPGVEGEP